jgi:cytochrome c-type biogenesis protein
VTGAALVYSSSLIAAFLGGVLALFAPCCVVSLMPTFVGVALRQGRLRLAMTTTVFAAGVAAVLLPVVLGVGALGSLLNANHRIAYFGVALVLLVIGFTALIGRGLTLPMPTLRLRSSAAGGVGEPFMLGIVSGIVSSCCAPVLAGVIALSALSASPVGALGLGLSYVFGMVTPLFIAALLSSRLKAGTIVARWRIPIAGRAVLWTDVASGLIFLAMGALALTIAVTGQSTITPDALTIWTQRATNVAGGLSVALAGLSVGAQAALLIGLALAIGVGVAIAMRQPGAMATHFPGDHEETPRLGASASMGEQHVRAEEP